MTDYSIENLAPLFLAHAEHTERIQEKFLETIDGNKENYPAEMLAMLNDGFNFYRALAVMAKEIENLKNEILRKNPNYSCE